MMLGLHSLAALRSERKSKKSLVLVYTTPPQVGHSHCLSNLNNEHNFIMIIQFK